MPRSRLGSFTIAQLEGILESRRGRLAKFEKKRAKLHRQLEALEGKIAALGGMGGGHAPGGRVHNATSLPETLHRVLSKHGAMGVGEIVAAVKKTGYKSNSSSFRAIVNQTLIKDKRFAAASRGVYQLKK
jgi:hypothetical protein